MAVSLSWSNPWSSCHRPFVLEKTTGFSLDSDPMPRRASGIVPGALFGRWRAARAGARQSIMALPSGAANGLARRLAWMQMHRLCALLPWQA